MVPVAKYPPILNRHCNGARIVHEDVLRHLRELFHILVNDGCLNEHSETGRRRLDLAAVNTALRVAITAMQSVA